MENLKVYAGKVLRAIREKRGLTCPEIAKNHNISATAIYDYEMGRSFPKAANAKELSDALRISLEVFKRCIAKNEQIVGKSLVKFKAGAAADTQVASSRIVERMSPAEMAEHIIRASREAAKTARQEVEVVNDLPGKLLPVITDAAAAECNPGMMPLLDCVNQYSEEKVFFTHGREGDFVIRVSGSSMLPWYPPKTLLLVRPYQNIQNGKRVVAVLDNGEIIFKVFVKTPDHQIALMSINPADGQDYFFPENGKGIRYICRVIQSIRNEDDVDEAMQELGIRHEWQDRLNMIMKSEKGSNRETS